MEVYPHLWQMYKVNYVCLSIILNFVYHPEMRTLPWLLGLQLARYGSSLVTLPRKQPHECFNENVI